MEASFTNYGGRLVSLLVPDSSGKMVDVVVGFSSAKDYINSTEPYFGATIGRYGNRIAKGKFTLEGKNYTSSINNAPNTLHGGKTGFQYVVWDAKQPNDQTLVLTYFIIVASYGWWVYRQKQSQKESSKDFFLAKDSLTWWAIGASLIASNISADQFIGMSGSGFKMGLAIATYEWMAAFSLIVVAVFFIPVYLKNKIYTMPQFLNQRYNSPTRPCLPPSAGFCYQ